MTLRSRSSDPLPFRLGTTSYVIPADILPNVDFLKDKVDDIELVLFQSGSESDIPGPDVVDILADYAVKWNLTYTVHLPYDVQAGSPDEFSRSHAVDTWVRIIDITRKLPVHAFIAHLEPAPSGDGADWKASVGKSLDELKQRTSNLVDPALICIETLGYDLAPYVPMITGCGFGITLDVGHLWLNGLYSRGYVERLLPYSRVVHLHGVSGSRDHRALDRMDGNLLADFLDVLGEFRERDIVVTLEVFSENDLKDSFALLDETGAFRCRRHI